MAGYKMKSNEELCKELNITPKKLAEAKKIINQSYALAVTQKEGLYYASIMRRHDTPSGCERWLDLLSCNEGFDTPQEAADFLNETKDKIEFKDFFAKMNGIPKRAFCLLEPLVIKPQLHKCGTKKISHASLEKGRGSRE